MREEIIKMAQEAGIRLASQSDTVDHRNVYFHEIERFFHMARAAEREECAKVCEQAGIDGYGTLAAAALIRARGQA